MRKIVLLALSMLLVCGPGLVAQSKKKEAAVRSVSGTVTSSDDKPVVGAVVQLTDTKTKQVRSFYTQDLGAYYFHGLSPDVDYELTASFEGASSSTRNLTVFDTRKDAVVNLKLNPKK